MIQVRPPMRLQTRRTDYMAAGKSVFWGLYETAEAYCVADKASHISARGMFEERWHYQLSMDFGCCLLFGNVHGFFRTYPGCQKQQLFICIVLELLLIASEGERRHILSRGEEFTGLRLMAFCAVTTSYVDTSASLTFGIDIFAGPVSVTKVLQCIVQVFEVLWKYLLRPAQDSLFGRIQEYTGRDQV